MSSDEDFQFLRPDPRKLAEEHNLPFDGKKMCWIPDQKEGYIKAEIISTKGEDVTVSTDNQDVSYQLVNLSDIHINKMLSYRRETALQGAL